MYCYINVFLICDSLYIAINKNTTIFLSKLTISVKVNYQVKAFIFFSLTFYKQVYFYK